MKAEPEVLSLLESADEAAFGTIEDGEPYVSSVGILYEKNPESEETGRIFLLLSGLARHTRNLLRNPEVSLLLSDRSKGQSVHERPRLTIQGTAVLVQDAQASGKLKILYAGRFPGAGMFLSLPDFRFYEIIFRELHWVGGFGAVRTFR